MSRRLVVVGVTAAAGALVAAPVFAHPATPAAATGTIHVHFSAGTMKDANLGKGYKVCATHKAATTANQGKVGKPVGKCGPVDKHGDAYVKQVPVGRYWPTLYVQGRAYISYSHKVSVSAGKTTNVHWKIGG